MRVKLEKGKLEVDAVELIENAYGELPADRQWEMVEMLCGLPAILRHVTDLLADEYSRDHWNEYVHAERREFLKKIGEKELEFYADLIAKKIQEANKIALEYSDKYSKLMGWCLEHRIFETYKEPEFIRDYRFVPLDWEMRKQLAEIVKESLASKMPQLPEEKE